jgi:hypothetical protein
VHPARAVSLLLLALAAGPSCRSATSLDSGPPIVRLDVGSDGAVPDTRPADRIGADRLAPDTVWRPTRPVWILHATDPHAGATAYAAAALKVLVQDVLPVVDPMVTVMSGDLTDGGEPEQWGLYHSTLTGVVPVYPSYVDIIGNHDVRVDGTKSFLQSSQTGRAGGGTYGLTYVDGPLGRLQLVRTDTAEPGPVPGVTLGFFSDEQKQELFDLPPSTVPVRYSVVSGHHPIEGATGLDVLGSAKRMKDVLTHFAAAVYLCGHTHVLDLSWIGSTLVVRGPTLGLPLPVVTPDPGFMLVALDDAGPSARMVEIGQGTPPDVPWPLVMITTPADAGLGGTNPLAQSIPAGQPGLAVRLIAFAPKGVQSAEVRVDGGDWTAMTLKAPHVWQTTVTAPSTTGKRTLEARATSPEGTSAHSISVQVGP